MHDVQSIISQSPPVDVTKPYDADNLKGKVIVITGGANGLGAHMVRKWASHGAHIFIGDIDDAAGEALVAQLRAEHEGQTFHYLRCNVVEWEDQVGLFDAAVRLSPTGAMDIVVPNAGVLIAADAWGFEHPTLDEKSGRLNPPNTRILDVNITGVVYTTHLALHHLPRNTARGSDRAILLIGSVASFMPLPGQAFYAMSKHAVMGLFRSLRATAFPHGVRVNMVAPYYVAQTNMLRPALEAVLMSGTAGAAKVEDVIDAATRLVADTSVSGRSLAVGPRIKTAPEGLAPIEAHEGDGEGRAVWECYTYDYDQVESFRWRYIQILNAIEASRGYLAWLKDIIGIYWRK
ncbi:unnamed protein product [Clonostachys rosea f. rosea IK726]|jgi:NAD(P)-dependent dehydrogenase (short-subunit alcohol dehydrogenase family)|uniref:5'-hydroxyaverantin dehydrogenase n=2 Tax=Bionectria ochroleuca TaxID=29856 RepID=A0A8H7NJV0_BIOOC|nr:unnamed protein product [Clonostachys rosea f. rosea IK726]